MLLPVLDRDRRTVGNPPSGMTRRAFSKTAMSSRSIKYLGRLQRALAILMARNSPERMKSTTFAGETPHDLANSGGVTLVRSFWAGFTDTRKPPNAIQATKVSTLRFSHEQHDQDIVDIGSSSG
jgi:hypothetical protein